MLLTTSIRKSLEISSMPLQMQQYLSTGAYGVGMDLYSAWDAVSGRRQFIFEGHEAPVYSVCSHFKENIQGTVEDANALVHGGKEHKSSYLLGRLIRKRDKAKSASRTAQSISDQYLPSLTEKIRDQIAQEVEEKVEKKVRENV